MRSYKLLAGTSKEYGKEMDFIVTNLNLIDIRIYLLFFSIVMLLVVTFVLIKGYKVAKRFEKNVEEFSNLTNDAFAKQLHNIETVALPYDIKSGSFGPLSKILDAYAVSTTDVNGIITYANEKFCRACGFSKSELIGKTHQAVTAENHDENFWFEISAIINEKKVWQGEVASKNKQNEIFWMDTVIFPLSVVTDSSDGYISLSTDMTKIKKQNSTLIDEIEKTGEKLFKVEELLLNSEKMSTLGTISAGIAHEINNPVAFVNSNMSKINEYANTLCQTINILKSHLSPSDFDQLLKKCDGNNIDDNEISYIIEDYPELIKETQDGLNRIKNIVSDLKSFSHQGSDEIIFTDLHSCINTALNLARNELKYKVEIIKHYADDLPQVPCMESKISQVFLNIFVNAAHAINESGIITVTTYYENDSVFVSIKDNGIGMDKEVQTHIFEPFYTSKPVGKGTGLGLSLSHDIISLHQGKISVESEQGGGTEFIIQLPLINTGATNAERTLQFQ